MPHFDLVIIGAGPAGAAAAVTGRRAGLTVALIDKARFPRAKLCGGLVTGRCARHLHKVFDMRPHAPLLETRRRFEFHMDGQQLADIQNAPPLYLTRRWNFDHLLFSKALSSGAADYSGQRVQDLDLENDTLTLASGRRLSWGVLIGADGVQSVVAKALFGQSFDPARIGFALEVEAPPDNPAHRAPVRIDFGAAAWGYGWSFPKRDTTTIGLGGINRNNPDMKARLTAYLKMLEIDINTKVQGHFLPFGDFRRSPGRGNILLAGDAAGFVDPLTGEGIGHAVHSGALAAKAAATALTSSEPHRALPHYRTATLPIRTALRSARMLRPIIFSKRYKPFFKKGFSSSRSMSRTYLRVLAGEVEYAGLLAQVALRMPRFGALWLMRSHKHGDTSGAPK